MNASALELRDGVPEWFPPLMVLELRQGLRSALFTWGYLLLLAGAGVLGAHTLLQGLDSPLSEIQVTRQFLGTQFLWLSLGCVIFIPATVFLRATGRAIFDVTEHLVLAGLTPASQAMGRFWAAGAALLMLTSTFLPIVALAQVLGGFDPLSVLYLLIVVPLFGWVGSGVPQAWAVMFKQGLSVSFGLGLLAFGLALLWGFCFAVCAWLIDYPEQMYTSSFVASNVFFLMIGAYAACFGIGLASSNGWHRR
ncbi:MAG: hypothetical protein ACYS26_18305 [Planctomycetota bacterium]